MAEISIHQAIGACADFVRILNGNPKTPPMSHSVWVNTGVNEAGEFVRSINIAVHPKFKASFQAIPETHVGVPIVQVDWPAQNI